MGKRLVVLPWRCDQSGDCCRYPRELVMTIEESQAIQAATTPEIWASLKWRPMKPDPNGIFVALQTGPCPLLTADNKCSVYASRPYNCRRIGCLRPDVKSEPYEHEAMDLARGRFGCANMSDRVAQDRKARRFVAVMQRRAQRWALQHGWRDA